VADHNGEHKVEDFSCVDQFFAMAFAQLTYRESLRDIEVNRLVDRINTTVLCDQTGVLTTYLSSKDYPTTLRRVVVKDDNGKRLVFLTNNFVLKPELIADLYRQRWQVELFFKWIKQHTDSCSDRKFRGQALLAARILCRAGSMVHWAGAGLLPKSWGLVPCG
jgi:hypothetical protein